MNNLGERIKAIRLSKDISTEKLASLTGVNQSTISRIENNLRSTSIDTLLKICEALEISIKDIFENDENLPPDLLNLIITAKKLSPNQRKKITEMIEAFIK
ncbi:helix-turn-helix domain-containing protein [Peribacillus frigoritolerans]|uniref:helix-turn-helix domain-containing protein n=1 Tax=Peribacillus frigoritolerans TaxID=450367 RepID=UPI0020795510|nr:helix-turn-helix domain-containing protein [Peribacillus frigoritolerans]MEE3953439.1 helix-turn-helix domain-containing protein [Peribacillus frigoritolerans]USK63409.1 helix-turn-helix domain-containing protein [Peribacillus frigoritolerans]